MTAFNPTPATMRENLGPVLGGFKTEVLLKVVLPAERAKAIRAARAKGLTVSPLALSREAAPR